MANKEITSYEEGKRNECMNKVTELNKNEQELENIHNKSKAEVDDIMNFYSTTKDKVVGFLFTNVINVKYEVPDVVKGFFEEKFGIKNE